MAPSSGPRATLTYRVVNPAEAVALFTFEGNACSDRKHIGALQSAPLPYEKMIGRPLDPAKAELTTSIPAGRKFKSKAFMEVSNAESCGVGFAFVPAEGSSYEVELGYVGKICKANLFQVDRATAQRNPQPHGPLTAGCE